MIMNESLVDFEDVGDLKANKEILPYIRSMNKNVKYGQMHVPTFGGGTARSEYEALTGNSIQFLPSGSVPYQLYVRDPEYGMADILKAQGYQTIAMHPHKAANWNREKVYKSMGFDQFFSIENWGEEMDRLRNYCSDQSLYNRIIDLYNSKEKDQKNFIFCVTMQNHGSYDGSTLETGDDVQIEGDLQSYSKAEQYLNMIKMSDNALKELVHYFEKVDEPTVIVFFGDHQPDLEEDFYNKLLHTDIQKLEGEELEKLYKVPFLIWANYDIKEENVERTSNNYLSTYLAEVAGIKKTGYLEYLTKLREEIPAINAIGYWDKNGKFYEVDDKKSPYYELIHQYNLLEYNNLFGKDDQQKEFFYIKN